MAMSVSPWGWTPYGGCDYYGGPQLANRAPWYGYPSPSPSFASGYGVACGNSADLGTQNGQSGGAHRVFVEMPPAYEDIPSHAPGPGSAHDHVQTTCGNLSMGSSDSDNTYWNIHTYQMPDHVQKTCNIDFTSSDASDDCYWSVHTFPLSNTKAHVSQAQSSLLEGMVGDSMIVPPKAEYHEMQVRKVSNPIPGENTFECVTSENQSQLCETKWLSPEQQRPELLDKRSTQQVSATVEVFTPMGSGTLAQQQHDVTKIDHTADPKPIFSNLLEEDVANKEDNEQREQEVQRKREQDEWQMEIDHFRYNAFDRLEEEHVCEADTVEFDADYVLSSLKEVLYDGKLSLCHFNFERWVKQISKAEEKMLLDGIADLPLLEAINTVVAEVFMSRIEQIGNPHWNFRATSLYELKFSDTSGQISQLGSKEWNIISTKEISKDIVHLPFSEKIASWSLFPLQQDCTTDAKLIIQWDPGVHNNRESARISLLHPVTIGVRLILPWDPGNYSSKIRTKWLPLKSNTTNVNLLLPWDPGEQDLLHVHHMAIILLPLASNGSYVVRWQFLYHDGFSEACGLHGNDFSLVSSSYLKIVHPVPKSEIDLQLLQPAGLMVCTISLYSKAETNLFCTSWAGKFHYVAPAIIDCSHLSLHEFSASIFALFKVCINIWKGVDTLARVLIGNIVAIYMRICAPALLQAEKCFLLDFSLIFDSLVHVLSIATVEKSLIALNEQVQMGRIAKYMHWIPYSSFIGLKDFPVSINFSLWWFPAYKRAFVQWNSGIIFSVLYMVEMLMASQDSDMIQVPDPLIRSSCMHIGAEAAVYTLHNHTLAIVGMTKLHSASSLMDLTRILSKPYFVMALREFTFLGKMNVTSGSWPGFKTTWLQTLLYCWPLPAYRLLNLLHPFQHLLTMKIDLWIISFLHTSSTVVRRSESPVQTSTHSSVDCTFSTIICYPFGQKEHYYPAKYNGTKSKVAVEARQFSLSIRPSYLHYCPLPLSCKLVQVQQQFGKQYMNQAIHLWLVTHQPPWPGTAYQGIFLFLPSWTRVSRGKDCQDQHQGLTKEQTEEHNSEGVEVYKFSYSRVQMVSIQRLLLFSLLPSLLLIAIQLKLAPCLAT